MSDEIKLDALAIQIAERIQERRASRPKLKLIRREDLPPAPSNQIDPATRQFMCMRIRDMARLYSLGWLVRQESGGVSLEALDDDQLRQVIRAVERAHQCIQDDVAFDAAGLVRFSTP